MGKKLKKLRLRIFISFTIFLIAILSPIQNIFQLILFLTAYLIIGVDIFKKAFINIIHGHFLDENFLMTLATIGAFVIKQYPEGIMVMLLYQVGEWFQKYAVGKSRKSISDLMDIIPDYANIEKNGELIQVSPIEVNIDDEIIIKPGEKIPLDGIITSGTSTLDTSALTGESIPRKVVEGSNVYSGSINKNGLLKIKVTKKFEESTATKILELIEFSSTHKAKAENFITKFAKYYTPIVVLIAIIICLIPPIFIKDATFSEYIYRACSFLVISCPCALVISIPLGFFCGIGCASKHGILIKGSNYLETLSKIKTVVFDKTGTLTKGTFEVTKINPVHISDDRLLEIAAYAEYYSDHPIANSIKKKYGKSIDETRIKNINEISGHGISVELDNNTIYIGNDKLMNKMNIQFKPTNTIGTIAYIAQNDTFLGYIIVSDEIKEESHSTIMDLKKENSISQTVMLTGDNEAIAKNVGKILNIDLIYSELLPQNKVEKMEELLKTKPSNSTIAFVGDGLNDAPVLTRADIGIAMGGLGSDAAIEAADIVIMDDNISKINTAIKISRATLKIVKQNIIFALSIKLIILILGGFGITNMWQAVFADVGVSFIAILNSMRTLNTK